MNSVKEFMLCLFCHESDVRFCDVIFETPNVVLVDMIYFAFCILHFAFIDELLYSLHASVWPYFMPPICLN